MLQCGITDTKFSVCTEIRKHLLDDPKIKELVGDKVYPIIAPEGTTGNFIVYVRDQYSISKTKQGVYEQTCIIFITCVAERYDISQEMADAVFQSLVGRYKKDTGKFVINNIDMLDSTEDFLDGLYIQTLEFNIK